MSARSSIRSMALLLGGAGVFASAGAEEPRPSQPKLGTRTVQVITVAGLRFRDLDRDGKLTPFEDWRLSPETRAADLVPRMTLEQKAATLMHPVLRYDNSTVTRGFTSVHTRDGGAPEVLAARLNRVQEIAETHPLAIPVQVSSDPRHGFAGAFGTSVSSAGFSKWPDATGFGAIDDPALVRRFGQIAAQEYRAVGITMGLSPQADLATEPRWGRISGTFGEDWRRVAVLAGAYVEGFQGSRDGLMPGGVATIVKHFAGYGPQKDGFDSHNPYGRYAVFPGGRFQDTVAAFRPAFAAKSVGVMPTYSIIDLPGFPKVGGGFNAVLLKDILRRRERFDGLVISDFEITHDCRNECLTGRTPGKPMSGPLDIGKPWGMENVSREERIVRAIEAGTDELGSEDRPEPIVAAVRSGRLDLARIDDIVRRIMVPRFRQGLFENPYVDPELAKAAVGQASFRAAALDAQQRSLVLLENRNAILPLRAGSRIFLRGVDRAIAERAGLVVVDRAEDADVALIRATTPFQRLHPGHLMGTVLHEGDLDFKADSPDLLAIQAAARHVPTIVTVYLDRPAILTNVRPLATGLIGNFGVSDEALLNVVTGRASPHGRLPFELPSSMAAVERQRSDVAHDSASPLYRYHYGLRYRSRRLR